MKKSIIAIAAVAIAVSATVMAAVTYDPDTGGFAGKGDVKDALGLSESQIRDQANGLVFTYSDDVTYAVPCKKETSSQTLTNTFPRTREVNATVTYEARKNGLGVLTGFNLGPATGGSVEGNVACPSGWENDGWTTVDDLTPVSTSGGGLLVNGVALPNTL